jgi:DnaJ-domain-containing protein 1
MALLRDLARQARMTEHADGVLAKGARITRMQDHIATLIEAVRRAQAKIAFYSELGHADDRKALTELAAGLMKGR